MQLTQINLTNFRNFSQAVFSFDRLVTLVLGDNARGKTNLLEAIHFLVKGSGFREKKEDELIMFDKNRAIVEGSFISGGIKKLSQIDLIKKEIGCSKKFFINKLENQYRSYLGEQTQTIFFSPEQLFILTGSPSRRRKYLDLVISYYDLEYKRRLVNYLNAIRKRNRVLERARGENLEKELVFWNRYLVEQADYITKKREDYLVFINNHNTINGRIFKIDYLKNIFSIERLAITKKEERRFRKTIIGPQKDDFIVSLKKENQFNDIRLYGSRSEQRLALFWLKANEIWYFENQEKKKPIILLDDIFSELDKKNRQTVLEFVRSYQTIITATKTIFVNSLPEGIGIIKL